MMVNTCHLKSIHYERFFDRIDYVELCVNETKNMQQEKSTNKYGGKTSNEM